MDGLCDRQWRYQESERREERYKKKAYFLGKNNGIRVDSEDDNDDIIFLVVVPSMKKSSYKTITVIASVILTFTAKRTILPSLSIKDI